jgi:DNA adenine methylase
MYWFLTMTMFENQEHSIKEPVVNVASVPQRSPFRYPGGKTWLIPTVRKWLRQNSKAMHLIEPFAGGGIVSLTAAFENLATHITMVEKDEEIAAVWEVVLSEKNKWLADKILSFNLTSQLKGKFMLTYDDSLEIRRLATKYKLQYRTIPMKTTHHLEKNEIIISDNFNWWKE